MIGPRLASRKATSLHLSLGEIRGNDQPRNLLSLKVKSDRKPPATQSTAQGGAAVRNPGLQLHAVLPRQWTALCGGLEP